MTISESTEQLATSVRRLVELDDNDDASETHEGIAALTGAQACELLERHAAHKSGEHRIQIGPCAHARPGDPLCDACIATAKQ